MSGRRFTDEEARDIRRSRETGLALSRRFGVTPPHISMIRDYQRYGHVDGYGHPGLGRPGRFTERQIRLIRKSPLTQDLLAERFGVNRSMISHIKRRRAYAWVPDEEPRRSSQGPEIPHQTNMEASNG